MFTKKKILIIYYSRHICFCLVSFVTILLCQKDPAKKSEKKNEMHVETDFFSLPLLITLQLCICKISYVKYNGFYFFSGIKYDTSFVK